MTKKIPLHDLHVSLGGKIVPFAGYEMPVRYSSDKEEHLTVRNGVGVFDVSHMGEFLIKGPGALDLIQKVTSNDASKIVDGQAQYSCFPNDKGGIVDDLIVYRFGEEDYMMVVNASNIEKDWNWVASHNTAGVTMENVSDDICLFAVQGPKAAEALQSLTEVSLADIKFYHFVKGEIAGIQDVIISGTGYTGAGGFELYVDKDSAEALWKAVFEAGASYDIKPIGLGARDTLRMEMGYCLYGNDITDETSPLEAGLGWITKFTKDFINSEALQAQKEAGVSKRLVGFKMIDRGIPRQGYEICDENEQTIGEVTSGTMSPSLNIGVGLGYVNSGMHKSGTEVFIKIRNKLVKAEVSRPPFVTQ
ncbi:MAG: glycine cleavage system aminomethyltransferase GcvT [Cytophagales bacterium]|nr:glycine cleavage system aminomethyltransferase GcvT [Cytophagales bacterium]